MIRSNYKLWHQRAMRTPASRAVAVSGVRRPSKMRRNRSRYREYLRKHSERDELRRLYLTAFIDREVDEIVALNGSELLEVERGEVLRDARYVRKFSV